MNSEIEKIWEAHVADGNTIVEDEQMSLRDPNISDKQAESLRKKVRALDQEEIFILAAMQTDDYRETYDPQMRLYHMRRLRDIPREKSRARKKYYGN